LAVTLAAGFLGPVLRTTQEDGMCRSIKTLRTVEPAATDEEIRAAALQFVRKVSGYRQPSRANAQAFDRAVDEIAGSTERLLEALPKRVPAAAAS
jgi:hypothetical protein